MTAADADDNGEVPKLPGVVAEIVTIYEAIDHAVASRETKTAIQAVVDDLHGLAADVAAACAVRFYAHSMICLLYTSPSPRDQRGSRMPSSA